MKNNKFTIILLFLFIAVQLSGQKNIKNGIHTYFGAGLLDDDMITYQFEIGYQFLVSKNLYAFASYANIGGDRSMKDILSQSPPLDERGGINDVYLFDESKIDEIPGQFYQSNSWALGLKKYIQLSPSIYFAGSIGATYNSINESITSGFYFNENDELILDEMTTQYGAYSNFGAKVGLDLSYDINSNLDFNFKLEYLTNASLIHGGLGVTFFLN